MKSFKSKFLSILFVIMASFNFSTTVYAEGLALTWAKNIGGSGNYITIFKTAIDTSGNSYLAGYFTGTIDFDPGDGTTNLTSAGANDIFIAKFDTSGNLSWAKRIGDVPDTGWWGGDVAKSVAIDASGNVYVSGFFSGTVDFDPGDGSSPLTVVGGVDIFVLKLDTSGNFVWAKQMGGTSYEESVTTTVDSSGNVYITGGFLGTVDFDPGVGVNNLTTASGGYDIFVTKLDTDGAYVWSKAMTGGSGYDYGRSIVVDSSGNVYVFGLFTGTVDFDPGAGTNNITSAGSDDMFIIKLTSLGALDWVKTVGGTSADNAWTVALDSTNNYLYTTGAFQGTVDFDPGAGDSSLTSAGSNDIFIQKLDSSGNFEWVKQIGGTGSDLAYSMALDNSDNVYTAGFFNSTVDFNPGAGVSNLTSAGGDDIFLNKLDSSGNFVYVNQMGGTGNQDARSVLVNSSGDTVYIYGQMYANTDLDPNAGVDTHTIIGVRDLFLVKLTYDSTSPTLTQIQSTPTTTEATITWTSDELSSSIVEYGLTTSYGTTTTETDTGTGVTSHSVTISNLKACNIYHYRVTSNDPSANSTTSGDNTFTTTGCTPPPVWILQQMSNDLRNNQSTTTNTNTQTNTNNTNTNNTNTNTNTGTKFIFTKNLKYKMKDNQVLELQKYLNNNGYPISLTGIGSLGNETNYFGLATKSALTKYQIANKIVPAVGYFGPVTRARVNR